ncbi:hypothetical protein [Amycolatopsis sp.]|uniref:hypothetical protein n=1 Tax=Amycolatopsis sp. TaxID=37632 RepID=UPI002B5247A9|nr:hypothetical protein [Amycolatopsis sp.]HVV11914.1 hypothetical protein [Amycolatopsis sp.]
MSYILEFRRARPDDVAAVREAPTPEAVRERGEFAASIDHSSSGGEWFRHELLGRLAAAVLGGETVEHLLNRGGAAEESYPSVGWLSADEVAAALNDAGSLPEGTAAEDAKAVGTIVDALRSAARSGQGLVTVYG